MKTSVNWLANYVDIPWAPRELAERLTMAGLEVEGIEETGNLPDGIVVAEIRSRRPHPNADRLSVCEVDYGADELLQIVCGAPNCDAGHRVPLAPVGTVLSEDFTIGRITLRGVESAGMLCSARELGLGDDHSGLLILPEDAPVGAPLSELVAGDTVVDWEITPNRPDWLSHIGIAREIAALQGSPEALRLPDVRFPEAEDVSVADLAAVEVLAPDLCPRYTARVVRNVTIAPSPDWMQKALKAVGLRPINNVVDITNYVLLECGQPLHAFDYELLAEHTIIVRRAADGESITTLDDETHELSSANLLIADPAGGVALAGVMGGANSEISDATTTVLLESAFFNPANIRATSCGLGVSTDSSYRFERGVDIEMVDYASRRAVALMCELAGGEAAKGVIDAYAAPYEPAIVSCRFARVAALLGVEVTPDAVVGYLGSLGLAIDSRDADSVTVSVPPYRLDLQREADLIEEVARLYGLANIPAANPAALVGGPRAHDCYYAVEEARAQFMALGLQETMTYSFVSAEAATRCTGISEEQLIGPSNALSSEIAFMRPTLIPGVLQTTAHNIAHNSHDLAFFELGRVIVNAPGVPEERNQVAVVMSGRRHPERFGDEKQLEIDLYDLKGVLEGWFEARRLNVSGAAAEHPAFRAGTAVAFAVGDTEVAVLGEVCDALTGDMRLKHPVFMALVELDRVLGLDGGAMTYAALPQFPSTDRDISMVADASLTHRQVMDAIAAMDVPCVEAVELFDIYEDDDSLGAGRKSMAYSITYRSPTGTLTDEQVNEAQTRIRRELVRQLGVELR